MSVNSKSSNTINRACIAVNRFGYGAREGELEKAKRAPKAWVKSQLTSLSFDTLLLHSNDIFIEHSKYQKQNKQQKKQVKNKQKMSVLDDEVSKKYARNALRSLSIDSLNQAINSPHSVSWRLLDFFSNHFSVTANGRLMVGLAATLEREAIAPNLLSNFEDILLAVEQHPAMLIYLNNEKSFGPNSRIAKKRNIGLNENLAREMMELHTLGVDGDYNQADVIELAKAITGWSVKNYQKEHSTGFIFRTYGHEPGARTLLGTRYSHKGVEQGQQILRDLAMHPSTIKHVCFKLAHHFVSETPPKSLLNKMAARWLTTQGNIKQVMYSMFDAEEAWLSSAQKFKTPREFVISTYRAINLKTHNSKLLLNSLTSLGQAPFNAGSPAGYSDDVNDWLGASALMARVDWTTMLSGARNRLNAVKIMATALGDSVSQHTYQSVMRAESRQQAMTLLLMSPEFQRR